MSTTDQAQIRESEPAKNRLSQAANNNLTTNFSITSYPHLQQA